MDRTTMNFRFSSNDAVRLPGLPIQTLGHLAQVLQWPVYGEVSDVPAVLLADANGTRQLVAQMLDTVAEFFQPRTIHAGINDAHGIGTGRFLAKHGWQRPFDILTRHLEMVVALCRERNLQPMMWSDMFFRIDSPTLVVSPRKHGRRSSLSGRPAARCSTLLTRPQDGRHRVAPVGASCKARRRSMSQWTCD